MNKELSLSGKKRYAKRKGHGIRMPAGFADMTGEEAEYGGGSWAKGFAAAGVLSIIGGGVCFGLNRIFGVGDRDTVTDIAIGGLILGACFIGIGALVYHIDRAICIRKATQENMDKIVRCHPHSYVSSRRDRIFP